MCRTWAVGAALIIGLLAGAGGAAAGAQPTSSCTVTNVTQGRTGHRLTAMVSRAADGDHLRVSGVCAGGVVIAKDLTISGVGTGATIGSTADFPDPMIRVLKVKAGARVELRSLVVAGGAADLGGGIINRGRLTLRDAIVRNNFGQFGIGIYNGGRLTLIDTTVIDNINFPEPDAGQGGGIYNAAGGRAVLTRSIVKANGNAGEGGGIYNAGSMTITGSRVKQNSVTGTGVGWIGAGGGIANTGTLTISGSFIRQNDAGWRGGGIWNHGTLTVTDTLVSDNVAGTAGGGIFNKAPGTVSLAGTSSVAGNDPDDCIGTAAC